MREMATQIAFDEIEITKQNSRADSKQSKEKDRAAVELVENYDLEPNPMTIQLNGNLSHEPS